MSGFLGDLISVECLKRLDKHDKQHKEVMKLSTKLVCNKCNNTTVEYEDYCGGTSYYRCKTCNHWGSKDEFSEATVFDTIVDTTDSLAECLIYKTEDEYGDITWSSTIIPGWYVGREDCKEAVLKKLREPGTDLTKLLQR